MEIMQLRKLMAEADTRETDLRNRLADAERRLVVVTRDLEESRSFVSKEDADARELLTAFNDLNEGVNDLAVSLPSHSKHISYPVSISFRSRCPNPRHLKNWAVKDGALQLQVTSRSSGYSVSSATTRGSSQKQSSPLCAIYCTISCFAGSLCLGHPGCLRSTPED